jgi:hypothetical protein
MPSSPSPFPSPADSARAPAPSRSAFRLITLVAALGFTSGCIVERPARVYYAEPAPVVVTKAPPAPLYEALPVAPGPDYVWIGGHWHWNGGRWVWHRGYYSRPPHRGAVWVAPRYEARTEGSVFIGGYWR